MGQVTQQVELDDNKYNPVIQVVHNDGVAVEQVLHPGRQVRHVLGFDPAAKIVDAQAAVGHVATFEESTFRLAVSEQCKHVNELDSENDGPRKYCATPREVWQFAILLSL